MDEAGRHAAFIWAAYGVTAFVSLGLVLRAALAERRERRTLLRLEADAAPRGRR